MPHPIGINLSAQPLGDDVDVVVLKILRDTGYESGTDCQAEEQAHGAKELAGVVLGVSRRVVVDHVAKDDGVQQRENLIDRRKHQNRDHEWSILLKVVEK